MNTLAITGLFSPLGRRMARLASNFGVRVLGIDIKPLTKPFPGVEFVQADIRNPLLQQLFKSEQVDTVLHCAFRWRQRHHEEIFDSNVMGTMRLLGAAELAGVRKVVIPSSTFVYGADPNNPAFLDEGREFRGPVDYAYVRELREIELFVNGYRRQQPEMIITVLRFANILGGGIPSPMSRYMALPGPPTLLGFDPMLQFLHHEDALRALGHCLMGDYNGVYNVAAPDPLPLLKALRLAGLHPLPVPHVCAYKGTRLSRVLSRRGDGLPPLPWDYLRYSWVADTTRMREELGFQPMYDAETTLRQFGETLREYRYKHDPAYRLAREKWDLVRKAPARLHDTRRRAHAAWVAFRQVTQDEGGAA
ncbi:MAG: NAD-dependent epimerase/dehydratase family protein [Caldilineae bacterium]|nr:MAG: NAD-dependent epimerase/dehydratase family protein [Caldilineae bacterium]